LANPYREGPDDLGPVYGVPRRPWAADKLLPRSPGGPVADARARAGATPPRLDTFAPQYALVSARHETQFSRLFRS
ncbi:hypothetical protein WLY24_19430, partial [Bordetella bronchiseptica]